MMTTHRGHPARQGELATHGVHLYAGSRCILRDIELTAIPGQVLALVGPNGAGKSSLLRLLAGLLKPSLGTATLDGLNLQRWEPSALARRRAMLSQQVSLGFAFRVEEVVLLGRSPYGESVSAQDRRHVDAALHAVQASHLRGRDYLQLSGGEQQRVQLARVLAQLASSEQVANWLLLDEPEASLDIAHQHLVLDHARQWARRGCGVIAVLHDLNLAARYADRIALLAQGQLLRHGRPDQVLEAATLSRLYGMPLARTPVGGAQGWLIHAA